MRRKLTEAEINAAKRLKLSFNKKKKALGLTQDSAAYQLGWNQSGLSHYLNGRVPLNLSALYKICDLINEDSRRIFPEITKDIPIGIEGAMDVSNLIKMLTKQQKIRIISDIKDMIELNNFRGNKTQ